MMRNTHLTLPTSTLDGTRAILVTLRLQRSIAASLVQAAKSITVFTQILELRNLMITCGAARLAILFLQLWIATYHASLFV